MQIYLKALGADGGKYMTQDFSQPLTVKVEFLGQRKEFKGRFNRL